MAIVVLAVRPVLVKSTTKADAPVKQLGPGMEGRLYDIAIDDKTPADVKASLPTDVKLGIWKFGTGQPGDAFSRKGQIMDLLSTYASNTVREEVEDAIRKAASTSIVTTSQVRLLMLLIVP